MALPPHSLGTRARAVRLDGADGAGWRVTLGGHTLAPTFGSEDEARMAAAAEVARLDAVAHALLRRIRSTSSRKRR